MRQHNGVTTQLNRAEGTNKAGRELICTLEERIWKESETTNAGQSPSVDSPKSTKTRHFCQQRPRLAAVDQPICYTLNEAIAKIPSEKFSTKLSKLKQRITAPKQMVGQKKEADNQTNSGRVISTFSVAEHGRHNNECGEAICYSDQTTTKQKSSSLMQQHYFETNGSKEITTKQRLQRLRRKSTSSRKNMSLSHRYTAPFSSSKGCAGFIVPPVFPKTCSLYDESFSGGVFVDHQEDRLLVEAVDRIRKRNFSCKEKEHDGCLQKQQTSADASQINGDFINENSDIDSGNSSITEGRQSPICSEFTQNFGRTEATQLKKAAENSDVASDANWKDTNQRDGFLRKNCRLLHFVKKKGSESLDNEHMQNDDRENDKLPAQRQWETDTTKRKSWRARLLRTLSVGSPSVGRVMKDKEKQRGEKPTSHFANLDREWEVVTVRELCRRLSLDDSLQPSEMPLPEGALHSQLLDEFMIRQIIDILPPRAEGYPWVQIYNSEKHGFSLTTLYRRMAEWDEEMSPVLLVVRDVNGHVFGAVSSGALKPCDHYYGTGDSSLLFRFTGEFPHTRELRTFTWTGENQFFVNATRESLSFGAGGGHFGLWLDADLNHGRSQKCATFDNEPLAGGQEEDFVVQFVEVFGFCMT